MSRDLFTREIPWSVASFARASTAYGQDGSQVVAGAARYAWLDPVLTPGTTNLIALARQDFSGWTAISGATITLTQNQAAPEWGTVTATRLQSSGGSAAVKYSLAVLATSVANQPYAGSLRLNNRGAKDVLVSFSLPGSVAVTIPAGSRKDVTITGTGDGATALNLRFSTVAVGDAIDVLVYQPQVENRLTATAFTSSSRNAAWSAGPAGRGLLIEGALTNLIALARQDFSGWTAISGAEITLTQNQTVPEWGTTTATRIQSTGGTLTSKYSLGSIVNPSVASQPYRGQLLVKNIGSENVVISFNLAGSVDKIVAPGEVAEVRPSTTGDGVTALNLRFATVQAGHAIDVLAWRPLVKATENTSSWHEGSRALETLTLPAAVLPGSGAAGSWEHDLLVGLSALIRTAPLPRLFYLAGTSGYIELRHQADAAGWQLVTSNGTDITTSTFAEASLPTGLCRLSLTWTAAAAILYVNAVPVATLNTPALPAAFASATIGYKTATTYADSLHQTVRVSSRVRTPSEIKASLGRPLRLDADTTALWLVPNNGEALLIRSNGQSVQLPTAPQRPHRVTDQSPQQRSRDSDGNTYVYHHGGVRRSRHEPMYRKVTEADRANLTTFVETVLGGARNTCTWIDFDGTVRTGARLPKTLDFEPEETGYRVVLPVDEEIAV